MVVRDEECPVGHHLHVHGPAPGAVGLRVDTRTVEVRLTGTPRADGWAAMTVVGADGPMPGWWRRDGRFLLTIACDAPCEPPAPLPTGSDLAQAEPCHTWVTNPTC